MKKGNAGLGELVARLSKRPESAARVGDYVGRLSRLLGVIDVDLHVEEVTGADKTLDVVVDIFNRVNSGGTKPVFEVAACKRGLFRLRAQCTPISSSTNDACLADNMSKATRTGKLIARLLGLYLACWVVAYVIVNGDFDVSAMVRYFGLAWTFNAFVRPAQTQVVSLGFFLLLQVVILAYRKWRRRKRKAPPWMDQDS